MNGTVFSCKHKQRKYLQRENATGHTKGNNNLAANYFTLLIVICLFLADSVPYLYFLTSAWASYAGH